MKQHRSYLFRAAILGSIWSFVSASSLYGFPALIGGESFYPLGPILWWISIGVMSVMGFLLVGVPLLAYFLRRGWHSRKAFAIGGFAGAIGGIFCVLILLPVLRGDIDGGMRSPYRLMTDELPVLAFVAVYGLLAGIGFWSMLRHIDSQFHVAKAVPVGFVLSFAMISPLLLVYFWAVHTYAFQTFLLAYVSIGTVSTLTFLIFGVPLLALFFWRGWLSQTTFGVGGSAAAVVAALLWVFIPEERVRLGRSDDLLWMVDLLFFGVCGFLAGLLLWRVMRKRICTDLVSSQTSSQTAQ